MNSLLRISAILGKEVRQLSRDRLTFGMIIGLPLLQILLFGYAINLDVRNIKTGVADQANTQLSRQLVADAQATQVIEVVHRVRTAGELEDLMRRGEITIGILIPPDFERRVRDRTRPAAQLLVDGSDPTVAGIATSIAAMPFELRVVTPVPPAAVFEVRNYYNPERRSAVQIVPALIGVILTLTMVLFTAVAIVRERERGNLELLITTPIRNLELMIGKIVPYVIIGLIQVTIIVVVGRFMFDVPVQGSLVDLYRGALVFIAASLGLGLVISTFAKTQFQAIQLTLFTFLPQLLLSGFMFPFEGMPPIAQRIGLLLPLTHFIAIVRGVVLRGALLEEMMPSVRALGIFFLITMTVATLRFSKRLD
jgi:ABC-2 type transport system permease protein